MEKIKESLGKAAGKLKKAGAALSGEKGLFRQLKEQHAETSVLMKQVKAGGANARRQLFPTIRLALLAHTRAEQATLYEALKRHEQTRPEIVSSFQEHATIETLLQQLDTLPVDGAPWGRTFDELVQVVERHVYAEEEQVFSLAKKVLSASQLQELDRRFTVLHEREMKAMQA